MRSFLQKEKDRIAAVCEWLFLAAVLGRLFWRLNTWLSLNLDSDMSGEMILARLLNREGRILTDRWYYSTELRVLNTQLIFAPLFSLFQSWHTIQMTGCFFLVLILLASLLYLMRQLETEHAPLFAALLICPFSYVHFYVCLAGNYYVPHIAIVFFTLGGLICLLKKEPSPRTLAGLALLAVLSCAAGMGGPRQIFILYLPLTLCAVAMFFIEHPHFFRDFRFHPASLSCRMLCMTVILLVCSAAGYLINSAVLSKLYTFAHFSDQVSFTDYAFAGLERSINGFLRAMGYTAGFRIFSKSGLVFNMIFAVFFLLTLCSVVWAWKRRPERETAESDWEYRFLTLFFLAAAVLLAGLFSFTTIPFDERYFVPLAVLFIPLAALFIKNLRGFRIRNYLLLLLVLCTVADMELFFRKNEGNEWAYRFNGYSAAELKDAAGVLSRTEYKKGYASFWDANVLTEFSDGAVEVWDYNSVPYDFDPDALYQWLQPKAHVEQKPEGPVFVLLTRYQTPDMIFKDPETLPVLFESERYIIVGFPNYDELKTRMLPREDSGE